jgi:hypothetical protein
VRIGPRTPSAVLPGNFAISSSFYCAAVGGISGHLGHSMSRADVKELGDVIDDGQATLVVPGESEMQQAVEKAARKAEKRLAKNLDVNPSDIHEAVREAAGEVG